MTLYLHQQAFVPICWSTNPGNDTSPVNTAGYWRVGGTGMVALYAADINGAGFETRGQLPMATKTSWGNEDIALTKALEASGAWCRLAPAVCR